MSASDRVLVVRAAGQLCALALGSVIEVMRPLPLQPLRDMPSFLLGSAQIRGALTPVVDCAALLGRAGGTAGRYVTLRVEAARSVALAVEAVVGVRVLSAVQALPPLLRAANAGAISGTAAIDAELLLVLGTARLVPEETWNAIEAGVAA